MNFSLATKTIGMADLQRNGRRLLGQIKKSGQPHLIVSRNNPEAVLVDVQLFESMMHELNRQKEEVRMLNLLQRAQKDVTQGKVIRGSLPTLLGRL